MALRIWVILAALTLPAVPALGDDFSGCRFPKFTMPGKNLENFHLKIDK